MSILCECFVAPYAHIKQTFNFKLYHSLHFRVSSYTTRECALAGHALTMHHFLYSHTFLSLSARALHHA